MQSNLQNLADQIRHMDKNSRKGQNGKVLLIGGSELFHAASRWSLDVLSAMVDMVFYSSVPSNNELIREAKKEFWDGVVVPRDEVESYLAEADVVLIGPGMTRDSETENIVNHLLSKYPNKKWVIDAGALQMVDPNLLNQNCIITPHHQEYERLLAKCSSLAELKNKGVTILLKGEVDNVTRGVSQEKVEGGNPGMTKGGTGDALAGLIAGLYVFTDDPFVAAVIGSHVNKMAGDELYKKVGPFFKTSDLVQEIPVVLKQVLGY
jgi:NAD(P)H-hydrate epimerase